MTLEGGLVFDLYRDGPAVVDVRLHSARPLRLVKILRGKPASEGLALLGMMYRICGVAQRYAGLMAWRRASNVEVPASLGHAQRLLLRLETLREHLWQVLVAWPKLLGDTPQRDNDLRSLATLMGEMEQALFEQGQGMLPNARLAVDATRLARLLERLQSLIEQRLCAIAIGQWREIGSLAQLLTWAEPHQSPAARLVRYLWEKEWHGLGRDRANIDALPLLPERALDPLLASQGREEFIARPTWQGACRETNAFTRQAEHRLVTAITEACGSGLLARVAARLVELVSLFETIKAEATQISGAAPEPDPVPPGAVASGQGLAMIEAARGRLIHWLKLDRGVIADYAIVAPTEWNFHPHGVAVQGLKTLVAEDEQQLQQQAALWLNAIDPCVSYELRVNRLG